MVELLKLKAAIFCCNIFQNYIQIFGLRRLLDVLYLKYLLISCLLFQLTHAYSQLVQYRDKYSKRFSATNLMYLEQLIFVTARLIRMLGKIM